jgi:hypothetical protein
MYKEATRLKGPHMFGSKLCTSVHHSEPEHFSMYKEATRVKGPDMFGSKLCTSVHHSEP